MQNYINEFWLLYLINLVNLTSPGAGFVVTVRNSFSYSRSYGFLTGLGIVSSSFIHKSYTFLGFGMVVSQNPILFNIVTIFGSVYLLYFGFTCFKDSFKYSKPVDTPQISRDPMTPWGAFRSGFLTDMLNPQASLSFIAIVTATVSPSTPMKIQLIYGLLLILTSMVWYSCLAWSFSAKQFQQWIGQIKHWIDRLSGATLVYLGLRLALVNLR